MEHAVLWIVGASFVFALLSFLFTKAEEPPEGGSNVPWEDGKN